MIFRKTIPFILCMCFGTYLSAQTLRIDSLKHLFSSYNDNSYEKGKLLLDISKEYRYIDTAVCKMYIWEALQMAQAIGSARLEWETYWTLGTYYHHGDIQPFLAYTNYKKAEQLLLKANVDDKGELCGLYTNLMIQFFQINDMDNVAYYADKILKIAAQWYDLTTLIPFDVNLVQSKYDMVTLILGAQIFKGVALYIDNSGQEALDFFENMFRKIILMEKDYNYSNFVADRCIKILFQQNRPREALYYLNWCRENVETNESIGLMPSIYADFAKVYIILNQNDSAEYFIKKAWELPVIDYQARMSLYNSHSSIEANKGNYQNALEFYKKYFHMSDSVAQTGKTSEIARMKNWFELEQKDIEYEILQQEKQKQKRLILILSVALLLIFALLSLLILLYRKTTEKNSELKKLHTVKDKLFSVISHDLRTPLAALTSVLRFASKKTLDAKMRERFFKDISSRVDDTFSLLDNLLCWSKNQMQKIVPSPASFNIRAEIQEIIDNSQNIAQTKKISLTNLCENHNVFADRDMFAVVVRNLIANAIKYSHPESEVKITAQFINDNKMITVSVKDVGIGMSQEVQDNLFKLTKTKSVKGTSNESGTGLGLTLCADFVKMNGGDIWFDSREGEGTTFCFSVPS
ncbi:MAG: HAMP domain-containing histidine kinase [Marinilabiliaceae bacterium]|nr:HAMP domain-containing histidine kinase [Marinilabiliaceae bacterium]